MMGTLDLIKVPAWSQYTWLEHGFTGRAGGVSTVYGDPALNLGFTPADDRQSVLHNRALLLSALAPKATLATLQQVHGTTVVALESPTEPVAADGMVTARPGLALGIQVADCVPLLLFDPRQRVVAALHAGWRGTVARIAATGVRAMSAEFGSRPEDLLAAIGPSIGPCCYQVGEELIDRVGPASELLHQHPDGVHFDLWEASRQQLAEAGVRSISVLGLCTACSRAGERRRFFSHRADAGHTGRAMGVVAINDRTPA